ncbi:MAG: PIN domain-containing protein [Sulfolobales archaeon]
MNSSSKAGILIDTSYLLPILGVEVVGITKVLEILKRILLSGEIDIYYSPFSLFEALGKISRLNYDPEIVEQGLIAILEEFKVSLPNTQAYMKALELKKKGFRDLIDLLLYTSALANKLRFLTRDRELIEFLEKHEEDTTNILPEDVFVEEFK